MNTQNYKAKVLKYSNNATDSLIYRQIRNKASDYFKLTGFSKGANISFWLKIIVLLVFCGLSYYWLLNTVSIAILMLSYIAFGFTLMLIGYNLGHDAAHHAVTKNKKIDNFLFRVVFGIQGLSGFVWQLRHNHSHHILPNIAEEDTDLEMGGIIILEEGMKKRWFHKFQCYYAPIIYTFASLILFFYKDLEMLLRKKHGNITVKNVPKAEWFKFVFVKISHLGLLIVLPALFSSFSLKMITLAFILMHMVVSLFMTFTFVISHHVGEVARREVEKNDVIADSWLRYQIVSTIDFNERNVLAHFVFGGFNLHVAHHIFPEISHIHYPVLTKIIRDTLKEHNRGEWYQSFSFFEGCISHLRYLKKMGQ